ncbi:MAG: response regulator [Brotaphodocola sp.]
MKKVLVVDDEVLSCAMIREIVEDRFPQVGVVAEAGNGRKAIEKALQIRPDVVIMDIEMPIMNGIEAAKKIREEMPDCAVVFLTAYAEFEYARQAMRIGASEFLLKPVDETELVTVLQKLLSLELNAGEKEKKESKKFEGDTVYLEDMTGKKVGERSAMIVMEAKKYIDANYMNDISIEGLAERFNISTNHFNRIFKQVYDIACKDYLITVRVEAAKQYLSSPILTVREVGSMIGYPDSNYFTKVFRKRVGVTPTEYRNQMIYQLNE